MGRRFALYYIGEYLYNYSRGLMVMPSDMGND